MNTAERGLVPVMKIERRDMQIVRLVLGFWCVLGVVLPAATGEPLETGCNTNARPWREYATNGCSMMIPTWLDVVGMPRCVLGLSAYVPSDIPGATAWPVQVEIRQVGNSDGPLADAMEGNRIIWEDTQLSAGRVILSNRTYKIRLADESVAGVTSWTYTEGDALSSWDDLVIDTKRGERWSVSAYVYRPGMATNAASLLDDKTHRRLLAHLKTVRFDGKQPDEKGLPEVYSQDPSNLGGSFSNALHKAGQTISPQPAAQ